MCHFATKLWKIIGYIFKIDDIYYFVQAHEVQSILYNCGRYYSSYFLRVLISLGKVFNLLLGNLKQLILNVMFDLAESFTLLRY